MSCKIWDVRFAIYQVASGGNGATMVSATIFFAHKVLSKPTASLLPWLHLIAILVFVSPTCS
jgi:hypothetical protein